MSRPLLFVQHGDATQAAFQVFKVANGLTELLFEYGDNSSYSTLVAAHPVNMATHFNNAIYAIAPEDGIYKYDIDTEVVTQIHSFSIPNTTTNSAGLIGFFPIIKDGETKLACAYTTSTTNVIRFVFVDRADTVTETANLTISATVWSIALWSKNAFKYQNTIRFTGVNSTNSVTTFIFDPEAESLSEQIHSTGPLAGSFPTSVAFTVHSGVVYGVHTPRITTRTLVRMDGQTAVSRGTWTAATGPTTNHNIAQRLFSHEGVLYFLGYNGTTTFSLWRLWQNSDGSLNSAQVVTTDVFGFTTSPDADSDRFYVAQDIETTAGQDDTVLIMAFDADAAGSTYSYYKFNGGDAAADFLGSALDGFQVAPVNDLYGGGQYTFSASGEFNWTFEAARVVGTNIEIDQTIYGTAPVGAVDMDLRFDNDFGPPTTKATLIATTSGVLAGGAVTGLTPLGSGEIITTTWAAAGDGIAAGDCPVLVGRLFRNDL